MVFYLLSLAIYASIQANASTDISEIRNLSSSLPVEDGTLSFKSKNETNAISKAYACCENGIKLFCIGCSQDCLSFIPHVWRLFKKGKPILNHEANDIAHIIETDSSLKEIDLHDVSIISDSGMLAISHALEGNTTLELLNLNGVAITEAGVCYLAKALEKNSGLKKVLIFRPKEEMDSHIGMVGVEEIVRMLETNTTLETIWLQLTNLGAEKLAKALEVNNTLKQLGLGRSPLSDDGMWFLAKSLENNTSLAKLQLAYTNISDRGVKYFVDLMTRNSTITWLNLNHTQVSDKSAKILEGFLSTNKSLKNLFLGWTKITDDGAIAIAHGIRLTSTIEWLWLSHLSDKAAIPLANLIMNSSLKELHLNNMNISNRSVIAFADSLKVNRSLIYFSLQESSVNDEGAKALAEMFHENETLETLNLIGTQVTDSGGKELLEALDSCTQLKSINLDRTFVSKKIIDQIEEKLEKNETLISPSD